MVVSVEHNSEFILIHTAAGYGRAVARILDYRIAENSASLPVAVLFVALSVVQRTALVHKQINYLLKMNLNL